MLISSSKAALRVFMSHTVNSYSMLHRTRARPDIRCERRDPHLAFIHRWPIFLSGFGHLALLARLHVGLRAAVAVTKFPAYRPSCGLTLKCLMETKSCGLPFGVPAPVVQSAFLGMWAAEPFQSPYQRAAYSKFCVCGGLMPFVLFNIILYVDIIYK